MPGILVNQNLRDQLKAEMKRCGLNTFVMGLQLGCTRQEVEDYLNGKDMFPHFEKKIIEWLED